jgi:hypothetical protein
MERMRLEGTSSRATPRSESQVGTVAALGWVRGCFPAAGLRVTAHTPPIVLNSPLHPSLEAWLTLTQAHHTYSWRADQKAHWHA